MVKSIASIVKDMTDASLDETVKELWGDEAVTETDRPLEEDLVKEMTSFVIKIFGTRAAALLVSEPTPSKLKKWVAGDGKPNEWQVRFLRSVYEVSNILLVKTNREDVKWWFFARSDYLAGYAPIDLLSSDPMAVRMAAMQRLMQSG